MNIRYLHLFMYSEIWTTWNWGAGPYIEDSIGENLFRNDKVQAASWPKPNISIQLEMEELLFKGQRDDHGAIQRSCRGGNKQQAAEECSLDTGWKLWFHKRAKVKTLKTKQNKTKQQALEEQKVFKSKLTVLEEKNSSSLIQSSPLFFYFAGCTIN